jgi:hypothetical protein
MLSRRGNEVSSISPGMLLVQAFVAEESQGAVTIDQVVVFSLNQKPVLALRKGTLRVRVIDEAGRIKNEFKLIRK